MGTWCQTVLAVTSMDTWEANSNCPCLPNQLLLLNLTELSYCTKQSTEKEILQSFCFFHHPVTSNVQV